MVKETERDAVIGQKTSFRQRIAQGERGMAETSVSLKEQKAHYRNLMTERQGMAAGGAEAPGGHKRQLVADPEFHSAIIRAQQQAEQTAAAKKDTKKRETGHDISPPGQV